MRLTDDLQRRRPGSAGYSGKRAFDLAFVALTAPLTVAAGLFCALAVRLDSHGPVFFRQPRVGLNGNLFTLWKFRTMSHGPLPNPVFPDEGQVTRVGRFLRRTSLDELPQLINVVRGEMSLVGPRPTLGYQVERYTQEQRKRLSVRPGLTGLAQIHGRNAITWKERIDYDVEYVDKQCFLLDLRILTKTVGVLLRGAGLKGHPTSDPIASDPKVEGDQ